MWQCIIWAIFDVQISYGGLKVLEFNQESISEICSDNNIGVESKF